MEGSQLVLEADMVILLESMRHMRCALIKNAFLPVWAKAIKHIKDQPFPEHRKPGTMPITSINAYDRESKNLEMNVRSQTVKLKNRLTNSGQECTFTHLFKDKQPSPEQEQDLITFREIRQAEFKSRVE